MKIGDNEFTVEQITTALQEEGNKADFDALRGNDLFKTELTQEGVQQYLETDDGKKILQPYQDRAVTKGIQTHLEKNKDKFVDVESYNALVEDNKGKIGEYEKQLTRLKINSKYQKELLKAGLNPSKIDFALKLSSVEKLNLDGDNVIGATDMINGLKESIPEFFGTTSKGTGNVETPAGAKVPGAGSETEEEIAIKNKMRLAMGLKIK